MIALIGFETILYRIGTVYDEIISQTDPQKLALETPFDYPAATS